MGVAPPWVHALTQPFDMAWSSFFGPLAVDDWDRTGQAIRLGQYIRGTAIVSVVYLLAAWAVTRERIRVGRRTWELILVVAIVARVLPIFSPPLLETDPYRYLWDGAAQGASVNPYRFSPAEVRRYAAGGGRVGYSTREVAELERLSAVARHPRVRRALREVNHPQLPTVYPPVAQMLFASSNALAPGNAYVLKALVALIDLGVLAALLWLLNLLGRRRELLIIYAWCPLILKEFPGAAHYDALASLLLLLSLGALLKDRRFLAGLGLGLAVMAKVYPVLVGVVLARRYGRRGIVGATVAMLAAMWPYLDVGARASEGILVFGARWVKNSSLYSLVRGCFTHWDLAPENLPVPAIGGWSPPPIPIDSMLMAKLVLVPLALGALIFLARAPEETGEQVVRKAYLAIAVLLVTSPVGNPWYLGWILPLAALQGSLAWPVLAGGMIGYYAYHFGQSYSFVWAGHVLDVRWFEYVPFYLLWGLELAGMRAERIAASLSKDATRASSSDL